MADETHPLGKTTVSPEVLTTITRMAALSVQGVKSLAPAASGAGRLLRRNIDEGVHVTVHENTVFVDVFLIVKQDVNIREVGRDVQQQVARAIQEMVGMEVAQVDIHIEDIDYEANEA